MQLSAGALGLYCRSLGTDGTFADSRSLNQIRENVPSVPEFPVPEFPNREMIATERIAQLVGKSVEQICFAQYSIYIHLGSGTMVTVESGLEHVHNGTRNVVQLSSPLNECSLLTILENTVTSAIVEANGDLQLTISNGDKLRIYKEPLYESYRLRIDGQELLP